MIGGSSGAPGGNVAAKTTLPIIGALLCGAILLLLLASTIVLALIPVYLPSKTVTPSSVSATSQNINLYMSGSGTATGRRKRDDMDNCKGCKLNDDGCKQMGEKLRKKALEDTNLSDVTTPVCDIISVSTRRKRFAFSKRASTTVMRCVFKVLYAVKCRTKELQKSANEKFKARLVLLVTSGAITGTFTFTNSEGKIFSLILRLLGLPFGLKILSALESIFEIAPGSIDSTFVTSNIG